MIASSAIRGSAVSQVLRSLTEKVGNNTASVLDINASNISLTEKTILLAVRAGTATREQVSASALDPQIKDMILRSPAGMALTGVAGVGATGTVTGDGTPA